MQKILKAIQDSMIRLELILVDLKDQLAKKTNIGHSHDITNVSGLYYVLEDKADRTHTHHVQDFSGLENLIRGLTEPKFSLHIDAFDDKALIVIKLVAHQGYCMDHITLSLAYRPLFDLEWLPIDEYHFKPGVDIRAAINDLKPLSNYHAQLTVKDTYNPLLRLTVHEAFKT